MDYSRDELVAQYSRLTADAAHREEKALWKVRRRQLDMKRHAFLEQEEAQIKAEWQTRNLEGVSIFEYSVVEYGSCLLTCYV